MFGISAVQARVEPRGSPWPERWWYCAATRTYGYLLQYDMVEKHYLELGGLVRTRSTAIKDDYPRTPATIDGIMFACDIIEMPVCIRICALVKFIISCAMSASRMVDSEAVADS